MAEAGLAAEGLGEHGEGVVRLAQVRGVDLARVAGEHDLGSLADPGEDRPQCRRFEVLGLVDDHHLALQRPAAQERHGLQRELPAGRELVDQVPGVGVRPVVGEGDHGVVDGGHPRVELLVETAGQEPDVGATDRDQRPVDRQTFVAAVLDDLLQPGSDGEQRLAGASPSVEGDDLDRRVEQQLEGEALLLRAGTEPPGLRRAVGEEPERAADPAGERRLRARPEHGELVLADRRLLIGDIGVERTGRVEAVDDLVGGLDRRPAGGLGGHVTASRHVLGGGEAEVSRLDAQRGVVGQHRRRAAPRLTERRPDDAVVRARRVEPVLDEEVLADAVELDLQTARADGDRLGERAPVAHTQLLDRAQRRAGRATDVVGSGLQAVELLDDDQRDHDVDAVERGHAGRIGDEDRGVEHDPRPDRPLLAVVRRRHSRREQIGQRHSLGLRDAAGEVANGVLLYRRRHVCGGWTVRATSASEERRNGLRGRERMVDLRRWLPVSSAPSSPATPTPRSCTATRSSWRSSIARRCSRATCSWCRRRTSSRCQSSTTSGRSSSACSCVATAVPGRDRRAGHVRRHQQRRQPERRPPARARRSAHQG